MAKLEDLSGRRFGKLTVKERAPDYVFPSGARAVQWLCVCDCGQEKVVRAQDLKSGDTKSCGCLNSEIVSKRNFVHGQSKTRLYHVWSTMKGRCSNPKVERYPYYGGRGIKVCSEWEHSFENFKKWAEENGYAEGLTIDRINFDGPYSPENCRWVTTRCQNRNCSRNLYCCINGRTKTVVEWCEMYGQKPSTVYARLKRGWSIEKALEIE